MASVSKVYVHIGPLKSGTSFIQAVLYGNRETLLAHQVLLPRPTFGQHVRSVLHLMHRRMHVDSTEDDDTNAWRALVDEVQSADAHTAVISMEFLCIAAGKVVKRLVKTLAPAEVHIVFTARDYVRVIPAAWQTVLRNKQAPSWTSYIDSLREAAERGTPSGTGRTRLLPRWDDRSADTSGTRFWRQQDPRQSLGPYLEHIPAERIHVVTVPPSGSPPGLLWERFSEVVGLDPGTYELDTARSNPSLGGVEAEVLRRVNIGIAGRIPGEVYSDLVKHLVARELLERRQQSFPLVLPGSERAWVGERTADAVEFFTTSGVRLYGDLADLASASPAPDDARAPDDVSDAELVSVTEETLAGVLLEMTRRQGLLGYDGPRSQESPMPPPEDLGLTGLPPGPGQRPEARSRKAGRTDPPAVAAMKAARRRETRARRIAARLAAGDGPDRPRRTASESTDQHSAAPATAKPARHSAKQAAKKAAKRAARRAARTAAPDASGESAQERGRGRSSRSA